MLWFVREHRAAFFGCFFLVPCRYRRVKTSGCQPIPRKDRVGRRDRKKSEGPYCALPQGFRPSGCAQPASAPLPPVLPIRSSEECAGRTGHPGRRRFSGCPGGFGELSLGFGQNPGGSLFFVGKCDLCELECPTERKNLFLFSGWQENICFPNILLRSELQTCSSPHTWGKCEMFSPSLRSRAPGSAGSVPVPSGCLPQ